MKDRLVPCVYYEYYKAPCAKGYLNVDMKKCKNCPKYKARKISQKEMPVKLKRQKDRDRHDDPFD